MLNPPVDTAYAGAVQVSGLEPARRDQLVQHILRSNAACPERPLISLTVARCAAALLAAGPDRLSCPTALAQAAALAGHPRVGPALLNFQEGLMHLDGLTEHDLVTLGTYRHAFQDSLTHVLEKMLAALELLRAVEQI